MCTLRLYFVALINFKGLELSFAMDITSVFFQIICCNGNDKKTISKAAFNGNSSSLFNTKLSELVASVTYMRDYLVSNKKDYLNIYNSILSMASTMTDEERDQIDKDVQDFIKLCNDVIKILKVEIKNRKSKQQFQHESNAILLVENYIKSIHEFHNKQKALRLRRNLDSQNYFRLSKSIKGLETTRSALPPANKSPAPSQRNQNTNRPGNTQQSETRKRKNKSTVNENYLATLDDEQDNGIISFGISAEEVKMFKNEGVRIYDEMNSMSDEVKNVGKKLSEIAKLQEAFSENVLKQEMDINHLNSTTITSTEYIREGNEQLREAMRKNAGLRVFILFFITTLAFVILFLDWYNG